MLMPDRRIPPFHRTSTADAARDHAPRVGAYDTWRESDSYLLDDDVIQMRRAGDGVFEPIPLDEVDRRRIALLRAVNEQLSEMFGLSRELFAP